MNLDFVNKNVNISKVYMFFFTELPKRECFQIKFRLIMIHICIHVLNNILFQHNMARHMFANTFFFIRISTKLYKKDSIMYTTCTFAFGTNKQKFHMLCVDIYIFNPATNNRTLSIKSRVDETFQSI